METPALITATKGIVQEVFNPKNYTRLMLSNIAQRTPTDFTYQIIRVIATIDCHVKLGDDTVTANGSSFFIPAKTSQYLRADEDNVRLSAVASGESNIGYIHISEMG